MKPFSILLLVFALSCCSVMSEQELMTSQTVSGTPRVKSSIGEPLSKEDSLKLVYKFQTSKEVFMQNYVNFANGKFYLSISRESAKSFGISDDLYDQYLDHVRNCNEQLK